MDERLLLIFTICIIVLVFILIREFWAWYLKINDLIKGQELTNRRLSELVNIQKHISGITNAEHAGILYGKKEGEVVVVNTASGETSTMTKEKWENFIKSHPKQKKYKRIDNEE